jgi:hypothetical protein
MTRLRSRVRAIARNPWTQLGIALAITTVTVCVCLPGITASYAGGPLTPP